MPFDGYVGADPTHRINLRVITELAWHALFARQPLTKLGHSFLLLAVERDTVFIAHCGGCHHPRKGVVRLPLWSGLRARDLAAQVDTELKENEQQKLAELDAIAAATSRPHRLAVLQRDVDALGKAQPDGARGAADAVEAGARIGAGAAPSEEWLRFRAFVRRAAMPAS